jgi:hypothetical protein
MPKHVSSSRLAIQPKALKSSVLQHARCSSAGRATALAAALALAGGVARAQGTAEPTYGRFEGDMTLVAGAGAVAAARGPRAEAEVRLRYLESVGVFASYEDGPVLGSASVPERVLAVGAEVRPLFLARWLTGHETQRARIDLLFDSLGLELGAALAQPAASSFASRADVQAGVGLEIPFLRAATGPWLGLHGGVRWSQETLAAGRVGDAADRGLFVAITLAWHEVIMTHLVDFGDGPPM